LAIRVSFVGSDFGSNPRNRPESSVPTLGIEPTFRFQFLEPTRPELGDPTRRGQSKKKYKNYINKVLAKLYNIDFYLNINKYIFFVKQIKYLDLIIIIKKIQINFEKIKYIFK